MQVKIVQVGKYADYETEPGHIKAKWREVGEQVSYPDWYAQSLIDSKLAEAVETEAEAPIQAEEKLVEETSSTPEVAEAKVSDEAGLESAGITKPKRPKRR